MRVLRRGLLEGGKTGTPVSQESVNSRTDQVSKIANSVRKRCAMLFDTTRLDAAKQIAQSLNDQPIFILPLRKIKRFGRMVSLVTAHYVSGKLHHYA
jgi:hypothetical protein